MKGYSSVIGCFPIADLSGIQARERKCGMVRCNTIFSLAEALPEFEQFDASAECIGAEGTRLWLRWA